MRTTTCSLVLAIVILGLGAARPAAAIEFDDPASWSHADTWSDAHLAIPDELGALMFSADGNTLYVVGDCEAATSALYSVAVTRDPTTLAVTELGPGSTLVFDGDPKTAGLDAGLEWGPEGTLFYSYYSANFLGQRPGGFGGGETLYDLSAVGVTDSISGLTFSPYVVDPGSGFGFLQINTYGGPEMYAVPLTSAGGGLYDPGTVQHYADVPGGGAGALHYGPSGAYAGELFYVNWDTGELLVMDIDPGTGFAIDANTLTPTLGTTDPVVTRIAWDMGTGPWGMDFDPLTGDLFVATYDGDPVNSVVRITGDALCADLDKDLWTDCDGDCDDLDPDVNPGMPETTCDGLDNDCDPVTEDAPDGDGDGYSVCEDCDDGDATLDFDDLDGDGISPCEGDCDEGAAAVSPLALEDPTNGVDDDCDGVTDECEVREVLSANPGAPIPDNGYDGSVGSMVCADMAFADPGDGYDLVQDIGVIVGIEHPYVGDLVIKVFSPAGTALSVLSRPGLAETADDGSECCGDSSDLGVNGPVGFWDAGGRPAELMGFTIGGGEYACMSDGWCLYTPSPGAGPGTSFADFAGESPYGTWSVCVGDAWSGDTGFLGGVQLGIDRTTGSGELTWYEDFDGDGFGDAKSTLDACTQPKGYVADDTDCDDADGTVFPGAKETCDNVDEDCDGTVDEGFDGDGDGFTTCDTPDPDCNDKDDTVYPGAKELCNGVDDDCDGIADDGLTFSDYYTDGDGDGYGAGKAVSACAPPKGHVANDTDCDDGDDTVFPGADEYCNKVDDDCDGTVDEDDAVDATTWYDDGDGDGYGDPKDSTQACDAPKGHVADDTDCDDGAAAVHPGADEYCNGIDDDCDGTVDEDDAVDAGTWYEDYDGDGYGDVKVSVTACDQPSGYVADFTDCDDNDEDINPGMDEICNKGVDDDCNPKTDETVDDDGDGESECDGDCDDTDATIDVDAAEDCSDGIDNDCDGDVDGDDDECAGDDDTGDDDTGDDDVGDDDVGDDDVGDDDVGDDDVGDDDVGDDDVGDDDSGDDDTGDDDSGDDDTGDDDSGDDDTGDDDTGDDDTTDDDDGDDDTEGEVAGGSGCDCRIAGSPAAPLRTAALLALALGFLLRRR